MPLTPTLPPLTRGEGVDRECGAARSTGACRDAGRGAPRPTRRSRQRLAPYLRQAARTASGQALSHMFWGAILAEARAAQRLAWDAKRTAVCRTIFPQMTNQFPD